MGSFNYCIVYMMGSFNYCIVYIIELYYILCWNIQDYRIMEYYY